MVEGVEVFFLSVLEVFFVRGEEVEKVEDVEEEKGGVEEVLEEEKGVDVFLSVLVLEEGLVLEVVEEVDEFSFFVCFLKLFKKKKKGKKRSLQEKVFCFEVSLFFFWFI